MSDLNKRIDNLVTDLRGGAKAGGKLGDPVKTKSDLLIKLLLKMLLKEARKRSGKKKRGGIEVEIDGTPYRYDPDLDESLPQNQDKVELIQEFKKMVGVKPTSHDILKLAHDSVEKRKEQKKLLKTLKEHNKEIIKATEEKIADLKKKGKSSKELKKLLADMIEHKPPKATDFKVITLDQAEKMVKETEKLVKKAEKKGVDTSEVPLLDIDEFKAEKPLPSDSKFLPVDEEVKPVEDEKPETKPRGRKRMRSKSPGLAPIEIDPKKKRKVSEPSSLMRNMDSIIQELKDNPMFKKRSKSAGMLAGVMQQAMSHAFHQKAGELIYKGGRLDEDTIVDAYDDILAAISDIVIDLRKKTGNGIGKKKAEEIIDRLGSVLQSRFKKKGGMLFYKGSGLEYRAGAAIQLIPEIDLKPVQKKPSKQAKMLVGMQAYRSFMDECKKDGVSYKDALAKWRQYKGKSKTKGGKSSKIDLSVPPIIKLSKIKSERKMHKVGGYVVTE